MNNNEVIRLVKENAGLKVGYEKYKRKYKLIRNILTKHLRMKIDGMRVQHNIFVSRLRYSVSEQEKSELKVLIKHIEKERFEWQQLYDMCMEIDR